MDGWIILDKERGLYSRTAGGKLARMFGAKTSGHIGTLDPMATGVLPVALGRATKMIPFVEAAAPACKEYLFGMQFGFQTDTLDITGHETLRDDIVPKGADVLKALPEFIGKISQIPPIYSAVHIDGRRAYDIARQGRTADMPPRQIEIFSLEFIGQDGPSWQFKVRCSRGTYVRALARDIAARVGAIATVDMIRRTQTNGFDLKNAVKLDFLEKMVNNGGDVSQYLMSTDFGLGDIPVLNLAGNDAERYINGGFIKTTQADGLYRIYNNATFVGIGRVTDTELRPKRTI